MKQNVRIADSFLINYLQYVWGEHVMKALMDKNWKWMLIVYVVVLLLVSFGGALIMSANNTWERGVFWVTPVSDKTYNTEMMLNGRVYCKDEIISADLIFDDDQVFPIERTSIYHKDEKLFTTTIFMNTVTVDPGDYSVKAKIVTAENTYIFDTLSITVNEHAVVNTFQMFSKAHLWAVIAVIAAFFGLLGGYYLKPTDNRRTIIYIITAILMLDFDIINRIITITNGGFNIAQNMPFHMCDISAILAFIMLFMKKGKARDILYNLMFIWGVGGAIMALLTPDLPGAVVQSYQFYNFFIRHGSIAISVLLVTFLEGYRPNIRLLPQTIGLTLAAALVVLGLDHLFTLLPPYDFGNYMFLIFPPLGGSPIDIVENIFGPSPYYMIGLVFLAIVVYLGFWLPFAVERLIKKLNNSK